MLRIREFERGHDEPIWINILNAAYNKFRDWRTITAEEIIREEEKLNLPYDQKWVAELNGRPVGTIRAFVQTAEDKRKGFIDDLGVIPESQGLGVEEKLVKFAANQLEKQEVETILVPRLRWPDPTGGNSAEFLERLGFKLTRMTSLMEIDLLKIPNNIVRNKQVTVGQLRKHVKEDVERLNWIRNESSKGQFNFRPSTVREIEYLLQNNSYSFLKAFFAILKGNHVGLLVLAIDEKYNIEKNLRVGIILAVGVLKNHRKTGIGTRLVLHGLGVLKKKQMTKVALDVDDLNQTRAKKLYEKIGFKVIEKYLTYEKTID